MAKHSRSRSAADSTRSRRTLQFERLELRQLMAIEVLSGTFSRVWERLPELPQAQPGAQSYLNATKYTAWSIDRAELKNAISGVPLEFTQQAEENRFVFPLPTPEGTFSRFELFESPIMEPALAAQFPDIKTYRGQGIDDPAATLRFDISPFGFRAQVLAPSGAYYIDPYWHLSDQAYISYFKRDLVPRAEQIASRNAMDVVGSEKPAGSLDEVGRQPGGNSSGSSNNASGEAPRDSGIAARSGTQLRTYRLANAATGEYTQFHGGTVDGAQAAIVTSINRVTGIYEKEVAVRLVLVGNNSSLVYTNGANDPYTNNNGFAMLAENQTTVDNIIGNANYDIGHVFSTGGGGVAGLGVVGLTGQKARGVTGGPSPIGDPFDVDYVAHEIGHQFAGNHTFNSTTGSCNGPRVGKAAFEPGSGTTIMAYAGICGSDDVQPNSDPYFHSYSFDEIIQFTTTGVANTAAVITSTGNSVPRAYAGRDYVIPAATPFTLDGFGQDADPSNMLTYHWEQRDLGPTQRLTDPDNGSSPLFRSWNPTKDTSRTLPRLPELLTNTTPLGERLPTTNRTLNFRSVVRDNFGGGGGVNTDDMVVTVVDTGTPFSVTSPNTAVSLPARSSQTITWNVANTTNAPISESQVDIWLSVDGGQTFPILLAGATANDGSESVLMPDVTSTQARVKVAARNSIFFDLSNTNFSITDATNTAPTISSIANVWIPWNTSSSAIPFQIGDAETNADLLTVSAFALDSTLLPTSRIEIAGTGANRTIRLRPATREFGETKVVVGVADEKGVTSYETFSLYVDPGASPTFGISVSETSVDYVEDTPSIQITSTAIVIDRVPGNYSNGSLTIEMQPVAGATDLLTFNFSAYPSLSQVGSVVFSSGTPIASINQASDANIQLTFNAATTPAEIESIVNSIRFQARGDAPETFTRSVGVTLTKGLNRETTQIDVKVVAVNDRPIASVAPMNDINEDNTNSVGTRVSVLTDRGVIDVDGTPAKAIVLTNIPSSPGKWQYDLGRGWTDIGVVSPAAGLVLGTASSLRFAPEKDFFGSVPALKYYVLDQAYLGGVSSSTSLVYVNVTNVSAPDSISATAGDIRQNVLPVNDPPTAMEPFPYASVLQDQSLLFTLPANLFRDVDDARMTLSAFVGPGVPLPNWLSFDPNTGTFSGIPRNKDVGVRQVIVRAQDPSGAFGDAPVTIDVINVNDAPTSIQLTGSPVPENTFAAFVGRLAAIDPDVNDTISWVVLNDPMNRFEVRGNDLYLTAQSKLDFEMEPSISFTIRAIDNGTPRLSLDRAITIAVADMNEFAPNLSPVSFSISESVPTGSEVGRVVATDGDTANTVRYRFFGTPPEEFLISEAGILTVKPGMSLDFETKPTHRFFVQAFDDGVPSLSTWVSASVTVTNANEFAPDIVTDTLIVSENYPLGVAVARVVATDRDNQTVRFSLLPSETRFTINPSTGDLSLALPGLLDFERSRNEFLTVIATDTGTPSRSTQKTVTIAVANANEPPTSVSVERSRVPANIAGFDLGKITIQDPDGPTTYAITPFDERLQVVAGNLVFKSGRSFVEADPQFVLVTLLLNDVAGGIAFQSDIQLERISNPTPWQNPIDPFDVDRDGGAGPLDALAVVNAINSGMDSRLTFPRPTSSLPDGDVDVDGDGRLTPLDVLAIVNAINSGSRLRTGGEGESVAAAVDGYFASYDIESDSQLSRSRRVARFRNS
jgi:hypothetical protein